MSYAKIHQALMGSSSRILFAISVISVLLVIAKIANSAVYADTATQSRTGKHILTVHDNGREKGVYTDADTLGEALKNAGIELAANDMTEPSLDEKLVAPTYEVNIYRARPVLVVDGAHRTKIMTPYHTPQQIAKQAKIELHSEDRTVIEQSADLIMAGAYEQMVIDRAASVNLVFYGKKTTVYTHADTVGEFLSDRKITPGKSDTLSVAKSEKIVAGMTIELWRNGKQIVTEEEPVDFDVQRIEDKDRPVGYRDIKTPGVKGEKTVTYEVEMKNGKEVGRKAIKTIVTKQPEKQVEVVGAKPSFDGDFAAALAKLRSCEGGYNSWNPAGPYYGAYQFDQRTWQSVSSAPYGNASPAEQDAAARALYERRGWQPWPHCGASLPDIYR